MSAIHHLLLTTLFLLPLTAADPARPAPFVAWDFARFAAGEVKPTAGVLVLSGMGEIGKIAGRAGVRVKGGQVFTGILDMGPLAEGRPFALEIDVAPAAPPTAYLAGLIQAGAYLQSGVRILLRQDLSVVVEHFAGVGEEQATYLVAGAPLPLGKFSTVRYEHDGRRGRLLIDGLAQETRACAPQAAWNGPFQVGSASGNDYHLDGTVAGVRLFALPVAKTR